MKTNTKKAIEVNYDPRKIEKKWQKKWDEENIYVSDIKTSKKPFYNLWMFPYPSAEGLHAGHAFASTGSDIYGRFMRMKGYEVFQPIGYDSFGIHSENYAIKINQDPHEVVKRTTSHYEDQMRSLGHGYDWTRTVTTSNPVYYKWTQWLFLKMWEAGLAYKKKASVNFCPSCKTVLADEQVMSPKQAGKEPKNAKGETVENNDELKVCERCGTIVEKMDLDQWFFKITKYADRLLSGLDKVDWSERVVTAQRNWIGKSEGRLIEFKKENGETFEVYTTRPDTLNAATFIVIADEELYNKGLKEKVGEFTGEYAINPLNDTKLPIWKTNYIAPGYGTGNVMGVPAYDERDKEFATKYHIDILDKEPEENNIGKEHTNYHLRDWLVSRQRYWGPPIPMIECPKDGWVPVPENDLPVLLPTISDYKPEGEGRGPLANHKEFYEVTCPKCGGPAKRETDVLDTFVDSSWYFLRYPSVEAETSEKLAFDPEITKNWLPVDLYFGGAEHSVLHLMYARFITMALKDSGNLAFDEPFTKFFAHGLMIKDGAKMSKSRGNVVNPDEYINKFGADAMRMYNVFIGPMDGSPDFRDTGIEGMTRFLGRVWRLFVRIDNRSSLLRGPSAASREAAVVNTALHKTIKEVTECIEQFKYNVAIAKIMELVNFLSDHQSQISNHELGVLARLLAPFAPHMMEEVWVNVLGEPFSVHKAPWPLYEPKFIVENEATIIIQINGKVRSQLSVDNLQSTDQKEIEKLAGNDPKITVWIGGKRDKEDHLRVWKVNKFCDIVAFYEY